MNNRPCLLICTSLVLLSSSVLFDSSAMANAAPVQPLDEIERTVHKFVLAQQGTSEDVQISVKPLDKRLRLAACTAPLDAYWSPGSRTLGRVTVQIECSAPRAWRVHVQATITLEGSVWVMARAVQRGDVLDSSMVVKQRVKLGANNAALASLDSPIVDVEPWFGYAFSQRVSAGKLLGERMLKPANLVKKGEIVIIRHDSSGIALQTRGVAMNDAAMGSRTQVRNTSSGKVVDAIVVGRGRVNVLN